MKVSRWKKMLEKFNDDDELCIAKVSRDYQIIKFSYTPPTIQKVDEIEEDWGWTFQEDNKIVEGQKADYLIY